MPDPVRPERSQIRQWVRQERVYADNKFDGMQRGDHDEEMKESGIEEDSWWYNQIMQYVDRARMFGLETPKGRQAMGKCYMTLGGMLESMVRVHGRMPEGGVPSGEVKDEE